jgi:hypothetical protein
MSGKSEKASDKEEHMKKNLYLFFVVVSLGLLSAAYAAQKGMTELKVGDEVYACNCGTECRCNMMANKAGDCTCRKPMVKAKVVRIEGGTVYLKADNWATERPFLLEGKYVCACGPNCRCGAISQHSGKCPCGTQMKEVHTTGKGTMMQKGDMRDKDHEMKSHDMMK